MKNKLFRGIVLAALVMAVPLATEPAAAKGLKPPHCGPYHVPKCVKYDDVYHHDCVKWICVSIGPPCVGPPRCPLGSAAVCTKQDHCGHGRCKGWICAPRPPKPPMTKEPFGGPQPLPSKRLLRGKGSGVPSGGVLEPNFLSPSQEPAPAGAPAPNAPPPAIRR